MDTNLNRLRKAFLLRPLFPELCRTSRRDKPRNRNEPRIHADKSVSALGVSQLSGKIFEPFRGGFNLSFIFAASREVFCLCARREMCPKRNLCNLRNLWILNLDFALR